MKSFALKFSFRRVILARDIQYTIITWESSATASLPLPSDRRIPPDKGKAQSQCDELLSQYISKQYEYVPFLVQHPRSPISMKRQAS